MLLLLSSLYYYLLLYIHFQVRSVDIIDNILEMEVEQPHKIASDKKNQPHFSDISDEEQYKNMRRNPISPSIDMARVITWPQTLPELQDIELSGDEKVPSFSSNSYGYESPNFPQPGPSCDPQSEPCVANGTPDFSQPGSTCEQISNSAPRPKNDDFSSNSYDYESPNFPDPSCNPQSEPPCNDYVGANFSPPEPTCDAHGTSNFPQPSPPCEQITNIAPQTEPQYAENPLCEPENAEHNNEHNDDFPVHFPCESEEEPPSPNNEVIVISDNNGSNEVIVISDNNDNNENMPPSPMSPSSSTTSGYPSTDSSSAIFPHPDDIPGNFIIEDNYAFGHKNRCGLAWGRKTSSNSSHIMVKITDHNAETGHLGPNGIHLFPNQFEMIMRSAELITAAVNIIQQGRCSEAYIYLGINVDMTVQHIPPNIDIRYREENGENDVGYTFGANEWENFKKKGEEILKKILKFKERWGPLPSPELCHHFYQM
jgi:hypothetical protein